MSYENPRYIEQDPTAFARGFEKTFGGFVDKWEAEKAEIEKLAKENDAILAAGYSAASLGPVRNLGVKLQDGLQGAVNNMVKAGFANKTKAEQALALQKVGLLKQGADQLNALLSMDSSNIDKRNSPLLMKLRNSILLGDDSVSITGEGEDVSFQLKDGEKISLTDIANSRLMDTSQYQQEWSEIRKETASKIEQQMASAIRSGMPAEQVKQNAKKILMQNFGGKAEDLKSYYYSNVLTLEQKQGKAPIYKSTDYLKDGEKGAKEMEAQENIVIDSMLNDVLSATSNVSAYVSAPKPVVQKPTAGQIKEGKALQEIGYTAQSFYENANPLGYGINPAGVTIGTTDLNKQNYVYGLENMGFNVIKKRGPEDEDFYEEFVVRPVGSTKEVTIRQGEQPDIVLKKLLMAKGATSQQADQIILNARQTFKSAQAPSSDLPILK